jgi:hypothetical protein
MRSSFKESCIYKDPRYKTRPILHEIKIDTLIDLINSWQARDIGYFALFISGRSDFVNTLRVLEVEKEVINKLIIYLDKYQKTLDPSLKRGNIWFLLNALKKTQNNFE